MPVMDEYEYLETADEYLEPIVGLINWTRNEEYPNTTYCLFLDLIDWTTEHLGETLYDLSKNTPGYLELGYLADALELYSRRPNDVREFIDGYELEAVMINA